LGFLVEYWGGAPTGKFWPLHEGEAVVGRARSSAVHFDDATVSRRHAVLIGTSTDLTVRDEGSSTGTEINRVPVGRAPATLRHNDSLTVGKFELVVLLCPASQHH